MKTLNFLHKFDYYLLRHHLHIWRTKAHYVLFFNSIAGLIFFLIGYFYPINLETIARNYDAVKSTSELGFMLSAAFVVFGLIAWQRKVAKNAILSSNWRDTFIELSLYLLCLFVMWQSSHAFVTGLNANIVSQQNKITKEERAKLENENYFVPALLDCQQDDKLYTYVGNYNGIDYQTGKKAILRKDSLYQDTIDAFINRSIELPKRYIQRVKTTPYLDSQMINTWYLHSFSRPRFRYLPTNWHRDIGSDDWGSDNSFFDFLQFKKVIKEVDKYQYKYYDKKVIKQMSNIWKKMNDAQRQEFQVYKDSIYSFGQNIELRKQLKEQSGLFIHLDRRYSLTDAKRIIDTCDAENFKKTANNFAYFVSGFTKLFENDILKNRFWKSLNSTEKANYLSYLNQIALTFEVEMYQYYDYEYINKLKHEDELALVNDSLYRHFSKTLDNTSKRYYLDFLDLNRYKKTDEKKIKDIKISIWNTRNRKYLTDEFFATQSGIDSLIKAVFKYKPASFDTMMSYHLAQSLYNVTLPRNIGFRYEARYYKDNNTYIFYFLHVVKGKDKGYKRQMSLYELYDTDFDEYDFSVKRKDCKIDTVIVTHDSLYNKFIKESIENISNRIKEANHPFWKSIFTKRLNDSDSTFLYQILDRNGFMADKSYTFNREYLLYSAFDLMWSDHQTTVVQRAFFDSGDCWAWSKKIGFCLALLAMLMYVTTSNATNLFAALFSSFFLVFFNFSIFKLVNLLTQNDPNMPIYLCFGALLLMLLLCAAMMFFSKIHSEYINLLFLIQFFSSIGIIWLIFSNDEIHRYYNYLIIYVLCLGILTFWYRKYLSRPVF